MTIKFIAKMFNNEGYGGDADIFDTLEEANEVAYMWWSHLTDSEKKTNSVWVEKVDESCLMKDSIDEDGNIDWLGCDDSLGTDEELFNSDEYVIYSELLHNIQFNIDHKRVSFDEYKRDFEYYKSKLYNTHKEELQQALDLEEAELED